MEYLIDYSTKPEPWWGWATRNPAAHSDMPAEFSWSHVIWFEFESGLLQITVDDLQSQDITAECPQNWIML